MTESQACNVRRILPWARNLTKAERKYHFTRLRDGCAFIPMFSAFEAMIPTGEENDRGFPKMDDVDA